MAGCGGMVVVRRARETDARGIAQVHVRTWQTAYRDLLPAAFLDALNIDLREANWATELRAMAADREPWVAETDGEIVGFVSCGATRDDPGQPLTGEVYAIYVLPDCWNRGVGRQLLGHAERDLIDHDYTDGVLWVLADNQRARAFYERSGWHADGDTKRDTIGGREVVEVRYRVVFEKSRIAESA